MTVQLDKTQQITEILNGMLESVKNVIPIPPEANKPYVLTGTVEVTYGVLIGVTGDIKGHLLLNGDEKVFSSIGQAMFGMAIEGEMLESFSGELGNMIAGNLSTYVSQKGVNTDITSPTVLSGKVKLSQFDKIIGRNVVLSEIGELQLQLLLNK